MSRHDDHCTLRTRQEDEYNNEKNRDDLLQTRQGIIFEINDNVPLLLPDLILCAGSVQKDRRIFSLLSGEAHQRAQHLITSDVAIQETTSGCDTPPTLGDSTSASLPDRQSLEATFSRLPLLSRDVRFLMREDQTDTDNRPIRSDLTISRRTRSFNEAGRGNTSRRTFHHERRRTKFVVHS